MNSALRTLIILGFFVFIVGAGALLFINRSRLVGPNSSPTPAPLGQTPAPTVYPFASTTPFPLLILPSPSGSATPRASTTPSATPIPTSVVSCQYLSAAPVEGTAPLSVSFTATGLGSQSKTIREYEFDFGEPGQNPLKQQSATATHRYDNPGSYTVRLRLRDSQGILIPLQNVSGDCTRIVTVRTKLQAAGSPAPSKKLPNTGLETSLLLILIPAGLVGLYLYRKFRLL